MGFDLGSAVSKPGPKTTTSLCALSLTYESLGKSLHYSVLKFHTKMGTTISTVSQSYCEILVKKGKNKRKTVKVQEKINVVIQTSEWRNTLDDLTLTFL